MGGDKLEIPVLVEFIEHPILVGVNFIVSTNQFECEINEMKSLFFRTICIVIFSAFLK